MKQGTNGAQIIQYIDQNPDNLPQDDPSRMVDFNNNFIVNFDHPVVFGQLVIIKSKLNSNEFSGLYFYI